MISCGLEISIAGDGEEMVRADFLVGVLFFLIISLFIFV